MGLAHQGYDTLLTHAIKGINKMPAHGGNERLSDAEVKAAVGYMDVAKKAIAAAAPAGPTAMVRK